jgi:hypothetical protein
MLPLDAKVGAVAAWRRYGLAKAEWLAKPGMSKARSGPSQAIVRYCAYPQP